jgi:hypothetical protein
MGLKTTNYVSKSTGLVLPEAYAVLKNLVIETDNRARAIFAVQASRENAQTYQAIDKVEVRFMWDRKTDPAKMAYEEAKVQVELETVYNENGTVKERKVKEYGTLYGWEDDIV